jgi:uncharacterized damage-inducible protein DinB
MGVMDPREVSKMSESSHLKQFRLMSQYNSLMNERIYQVVATLSMEERERDMGIFFRSIHGTLNHILLADRIWMSRFATCTTHKFSTLDNAKLIFEFESLKQILYSDFEELRHERMETDKSILQWIQELTPEILSTSLHYTNSSGVERSHELWFALTHFFNHQTHHRGQVTALLNQLNKDYGVTDFPIMYDLAQGAV